MIFSRYQGPFSDSIKLIGLVLLVIFSLLLGMYAAKRNLPPYTWVRSVYLMSQEQNWGLMKGDLVEVRTDHMILRGLPGHAEEGDFSRLPLRVSKYLSEPLRHLGRNTAGGIASFRTDSLNLKVVANIDPNRHPNMSELISSGFDVYVDGKFYANLFSNDYKLNETIKFSANSEKNIDVYFPTYGNISSIKFFVDKNALTKLPNVSEKLIIYYGSSITQGCCASNPAMSYPSIVSRKLGVEQINLGFSGNGLGDIEIASFINELSPTIIVLDFWANPSPSVYQKTLTPFIQRIRSVHRKVPIIVTSAFANPRNEQTQKRKDQIAIQAVRLAKESGDRNVYFVDGLLNENEVDGLVDAKHPNSYGFSLVGRRLSHFIAKNDLLN